jgi:putative peptide zinc metalloprotease protein
MTEPLFSSSWYRVAALKPRLRPHARLYRHHYRGEVWFVMQDPASGRMHRFNPAARLILNGMDGSRTIQELWEIANRRLGESAPTQDELIQLLGQLHAADLVQCDVSPDVAELVDRAKRQERARLGRSIGNPMAIKLSLVDPDRFLNWLLPYVQRIWNRWGAIAWLAVVVPAVLLVPLHWSELTSNISDRVLAANNLFMLFLLFPCIKILHELGHGIATKIRGGEVHDLGIIFLVLMPVPYVDASAATTFRSKIDRAIVGAAGMLVEVFLAALAMYVWLLVEPGTVRAMAFNVMLVAGVSTIIFNGNPLLRYDAYYILADLIEIPNLATRSTRYLGYLVERYVFGARNVEEPRERPAEKAWFVFYAIASFTYRTFITILIILFIAGEFFVIGVLLALWAFVMMAIVPVVKAVQHLVASPRLARARGRVYAVTAGVLAGIALFVFLIPMPFRTQAEGVVWLPEQAIVRAGANGFHSRLLVEPGTWVRQGDALIESVDPVLDAQVRVGEARVAELKATFDAHFVNDRVAAEIAREQLEREEAALALLKRRAADLIVVSLADGHFLVPHAPDMPGRFFRKGELMGYVTDRVRPLARVVVQQGEVDVVRLATREVELRSVYRVGEVVKGTVLREVPGGIDQLPSRALSVEGGGQLATDPRDAKGTKGLQRTFQLDIDLPVDGFALYGGRVHVRFEHVKEPLASQWYRAIRRLFLTRFYV